MILALDRQTGKQQHVKLSCILNRQTEKQQHVKLFYKLA